MKRWLIALVVLVLVAAACGSDDGDGDNTTAAPAAVATTAAPDAPVATDPPAATQPTAATNAPAETDVPAVTTAPEGTVADLAITEVVFGDHVTITNLGEGTVNVDGLWLCNRPSYTEISVNLAPGESETVDAGKVGGLGGGGGEVALYTSSDFGDPGSIIDYVNWGGAGGRASVATGAGIWPDGDTVATDGAGISAPGGGESSTDWSSQ